MTENQAPDPAEAAATPVQPDAQPEAQTPDAMQDGPVEQWTLEELASLSEAERAGLMPEPAPAPETPAPAPEAPAPEPKPAEPAPQPDPEPAKPAEQPRSFDMRQANQGLAAINDQIKTLRTEYADGGIDDAAFEQRLDVLVDRKSEIRAAIMQAEQQAIGDHQKRLAEWWDAADAYKAEHPALWEAGNLTAWDKVLIETNNKYADWNIPDAQRLKLAHQEFNRLMGDVVPMGQAPAEPATPAARAKPAAPEIPPNLSAIPGSEGASASGRFAAVDSAVEQDVYRGEAAVASMTPAQYDAWLAVT